MDDDEILRRLEEIFGPPPTPRRQALTPRMLDDILASRTHVRVLRVLVAEDRRINPLQDTWLVEPKPHTREFWRCCDTSGHRAS
jgi:hypothetical protein